VKSNDTMFVYQRVQLVKDYLQTSNYKKKGRCIMAREKIRIIIKDLPKGKKISREEMNKVFGGNYIPMPPVMNAPQVPPTSWPSPEDLPSAYWWKPFSK